MNDWNNINQNLSTVEYKGLESMLDELIRDYEKEYMGEIYTDIKEYTIYRDGEVQVLDGYYDVYIMGDIAISSIFMNNNNVVYIECYHVIQDEFIPDYDRESYIIRVN